jgi:hypothetical protein
MASKLTNLNPSITTSSAHQDQKEINVGLQSDFLPFGINGILPPLTITTNTPSITI